MVEPEAPTLAALAPERVVHIEALSNALAPGLRAALVHTPKALGEAFDEARFAFAYYGPRLVAEVATHWIRSGIAEEAARAVAAVNRARLARARRVLGARIAPSPAAAPFVRLAPPEGVSPARFAEMARGAGVVLLPPSRFALDGGDGGGFVRIALSSARGEDELDRALDLLRALGGAARRVS